MPSTVATDLSLTDGASAGLPGCRCALCSGQAALGGALGTGGSPAATPAAAPLAAQGDIPSYVAALLPSSMPKWGSTTAGTAASVTYSFMESAPSYLGTDDRNGFAAMSQTQRAAVRQALAAWAAVANITFTEVSDSGSGGSMRFGTNAQQGVSVGYAYYPSTLFAIAGDVFIANDSSGNSNPTVGSYGYKTLLHEIGHAIGLKHPGNYNAGGGGTEGPYLPTAEDNYQYSLMSYNSHPSLGLLGLATGPALYDIAAIQYLYGANSQTRTGNDSYALNDTAAPFSLAIWDAAGLDSLDASGQTQGVALDLRAGHFSSAGTNGANAPAVGNVSIAYGAVIENATGGSGDDALVGNAVSNVLTGGAGNDTLTGAESTDTLEGGAGTDTAVYSGSRSTYDISRSGTTLTIAQRAGSGTDGTDTLTNVEYAQFADGRVSLRWPTVVAAVAKTTTGATVAGSSLFTASDPDNLFITGYELVDTTTGGGYFTLNGTTQTAGTAFAVAATSLSAVSFIGGAAVGSDQLSVRAYNGILWSDWTSWSIVTELPNRNPTLQANRSVSLQEGAAATALGITTPTDADGDTLTVTVQAVPGRGSLKLANGTAVSSGSTLSAADVGRLTFTPETGFSGAAGTFSYTASDGRGGTAQQTVTLSVVSLASQLASFDPLLYLASNPDLAAAFGTDTAAARQHFISTGRFEGRATSSFDPYAYLVANPDLLSAFGVDRTAALNHYIRSGRLENRATTGFSAVSYLAANADLYNAFGLDEAAATRHYIQLGRTEGRSTSFDSLGYLAANADLYTAFGLDATAAARHYLQLGRAEGRSTSFDSLAYLAANPDLAQAYGLDTTAAVTHYLQYGRSEGRSTSFNVAAYLVANPDLLAAFGSDTAAAERHYIQYGRVEGRRLTTAARASLAADPDSAAVASFTAVGLSSGLASTGFGAPGLTTGLLAAG